MHRVTATWPGFHCVSGVFSAVRIPSFPPLSKSCLQRFRAVEVPTLGAGHSDLSKGSTPPSLKYRSALTNSLVSNSHLVHWRPLLKNAMTVVRLLVLSTMGSVGLYAQITTVGSTKASSLLSSSSKWSATVNPAAGDTLLVGCDYDAGNTFIGVSDRAGDTFLQIGAEARSGDFAERAYIATKVKGGLTTVTCTAASSPPYDEIYVTELAGVNSARPIDTQVSSSGPASPSSATLTTAAPNEFLWAFVVSGRVTNTSGWTGLSTFDGNLIAKKTQGDAGVVNPSFSVSSDWTMIVAALNPAIVIASVPAVSVLVNPTSASMQVSNSTGVTAIVQNDSANKGVTWSLSGNGCSGSTCGTLSSITASSVTYTAPSIVPTPASVTLTATSVSDASKSASTSVTVTAATPLTISAVGAGNISSEGATITWTTNAGASSQVDYGSTAAYGQSSTLNSNAVTSHSVILTGLTASTLYHYRVDSADASNNQASSGDFTFTTAANSGSLLPTLVQRTSTSNTQSNSVDRYVLQLPNGTQGGDAIIVGFSYSHFGSPTVSVADDGGNSYSCPAGALSNDNNQMAQLCFALNVASGTRSITISFSGSAPTHIAAAAYEFLNVASSGALDGSTGNSNMGGTGSNVSAGSFTPTTSGDLIFQYAIADGSLPMSSWTAGTNPWALLNADLQDGQATQYQVQGAGAAINPNMTMGPAGSWNTVAIALKAANAGSAPPAGIRVVGVQHIAVAQSFSSNPIAVQFPCTGNLIVAVWLGITGYDISSISDNGSNIYTATGPPVNFGASGDAQIFYAGNATCTSTRTLNFKTNGSNSSGGSELVLYDIAGAAPSPSDGSGTATGNQSTAGNVPSASVTPSTSNGVIIAMITVESHTITGSMPGLFDAASTSPIIGISPVDQNGGLAHNYNSDTSPETFVWTTTAGAVGNWASIVAAFKPQ